MPLASRDEEVSEVKAGDPVLQWRPLLRSTGRSDASGIGPSQAHAAAKTQAGLCGAGPGAETGLVAGRMVMARENAVKNKGMMSFAVLHLFVCFTI